MKILVVEDDNVAILGVRKILKSIEPPVDVLIAENGKEGLDLLAEAENADVDFVLLDLNMPIMNGIEFLSAVRKNNLIQDLPIVVHSTSDNPQEVKKSRELGIHGYFVKHFDYSQFRKNLITIVNYWTESKQKKT